MSASENRQKDALVGLRMRPEWRATLETEATAEGFKSVQELILHKLGFPIDAPQRQIA